MKRTLPLCTLAMVLVGACSSTVSNPKFVAPEGQHYLKERVRAQLRDLEELTGKRFRGQVIELAEPVASKYSDWRGMPVAEIRGREQGGLTSWKVLEKEAKIYFAHRNGKIPEWLIRHETLHTILLSNGIPGHPSRYIRHFARAYWWLPETKMRRSAHLALREASCCPICGEIIGGALPSTK